jgi:carbon monoxide dehydrogenase subunit G
MMLIEQTFSVEASRDATVAFFLDADRVTRCIPGAQDVREVAPGNYEAVLGVRLGPIRAAFQGTLRLDDSEAPARLTASGEGRDRATGSLAKVQLTVDLQESRIGLTTVHAVADIALRGRMAQFGTGVMRAAAGELVQEFASCVNASLAVTESATATSGGVAAHATAAAGHAVDAAPPRLLGLVLRSVLKMVRNSASDLAARIRRKPSRHEGPRS